MSDEEVKGPVELTDDELTKVAGGYEQKTYTKDPYADSKTSKLGTETTDPTDPTKTTTTTIIK